MDNADIEKNTHIHTHTQFKPRVQRTQRMIADKQLHIFQQFSVHNVISCS